MWKVNNEENKKYLINFEAKLIKPMFKEMINYKKIKCSDNYLKYLEDNKLTVCKGSNELLLYVMNREHKKVKFMDLINKFIAGNCMEEIIYFYKIYSFQNTKINHKEYDIRRLEIDENLKKIFTDFFYEKFFAMEKIWELIDSRKYKYNPFSREKFHENFKMENKLYVCPYCDIDTTISISNNEIEHFMPKSIYPFISMNAYNLIPACKACNRSQEGKGKDIYIPTESPYSMEIGNNIEYENDFVNKEIILKCKDNKVNNYIKTLNLINRYKKNIIYELVEERAQQIYDTIVEAETRGESIDQKQLKKYMLERKLCKSETLSFAVNGAFSGLDHFRRYKEK